jgi:hypothetical protein
MYAADRCLTYVIATQLPEEKAKPAAQPSHLIGARTLQYPRKRADSPSSSRVASFITVVQHAKLRAYSQSDTFPHLIPLLNECLTWSLITLDINSVLELGHFSVQTSFISGSEGRNQPIAQARIGEKAGIRHSVGAKIWGL